MTHTSVLVMTASVSHVVSVGIVSPFHIQEPPQEWRNSVKNCSSGAGGWWRGIPLLIMCREPLLASEMLTGTPVGGLAGTMFLFLNLFGVRPLLSGGE